MANGVDELTDAPFRLGDWHIDPSLGRITGSDSDTAATKVEPQVMAVLLCLAKQQGEVVSREDIEAQAWANRVVGYDSLSTAIIKLRKALGDDSKNPRYIETVPKKGYRLIATVTPSADTEPAQTSSKVKPRRQVFKLGLILTVVIVGLGFVLYNKIPSLFTDTPVIQRNSIAVLPFKNISGDIQQEYFSDCINADLIT